MATSKLSLCNRALARVGQATAISDFDADVARGLKSAVACDLIFEDVLKEVARSGRWNCLKTRTTLISSYDTAYALYLADNPGDTAGAIAAGEAVSPAFGWSRSYTLPETCVRLIQLNGVDAFRDDLEDYFEIEGRTLLTDAETAEIQFIEVQTEWAPEAQLVPHEVTITLADTSTVPLFDTTMDAIWADIMQHPDGSGDVLISNGGTPVTNRELSLPPSGGETLHDLAHLHLPAPHVLPSLFTTDE